ncbi:cell wall-active antibiotics response protein [Nocardia sp. NBC_01503]|uniref:hypothetical protein n=1 Tax=Nocardia sp. NBC_01503 TaxID=2975997 RepID=UPI002E7B34DB|nr:hypothetical protein [Nocardia sp. NBC_01503]WTL34797.1 cell wall-active antibiotics response protein [Nocardia sp. NBC_01503]
MSRTTEQRRVPAFGFDDLQRFAAARKNAARQRTPSPAAPPLELRVTSESRRTDEQWTVPEKLVAECTSGKVVIDFTQAYCSRRAIDMRINAGSGTIVVIVPRGWRVDLDAVEFGPGGHISNRVTLPRFPGAPLIHIEGRVESGALKARYAFRSPVAWLRRSR